MRVRKALLSGVDEVYKGIDVRVLRGLGMRGYVSAGVGFCPVCHDMLGSELVMLPCGHQLCCKCSMTLIDRAPQSALPQVPSNSDNHTD